MTRIAALQLNATDDRARNFEQAAALIGEAAAQGARFIATPENTDQIAPRESRLASAEPVDGPLVTRFRQLATTHGVWLLLGSFAERAADGRIHNTSVLISAIGAIEAVYRKIHLFDASPPDGVPYRESESVAPGSEVVTAATPLGTVGLSICYDVRFPELYRQHSVRGASLITVPSAFTVPTGRAHWEVLLRARAIENLAYVIAPAQVGEHGHGRRSHGHALIVDPWGQVLADAGGEGAKVITAEFDENELRRCRAMIPALTHRRL
jgi:predicted amidohydrolase